MGERVRVCLSPKRATCEKKCETRLLIYSRVLRSYFIKRNDNMALKQLKI